MSFNAVGFVGTALPASFMTMCIVTCPVSPKTVGHGEVAEQGSGLMMFVMTSEISVEAGAPADTAPRMPCSESITMNEGPRPPPVPTCVPQETVAAAMATTARNRVKRNISILNSALDDARGDENQQLRALVVQRVALE